tara:strand:- start:380 stop:1522 length:1143 start_codon:yes stop_codon:yes gene_type:complete
MGDATVKPSSGDDLILSNDDGSAKIEVNEGAEINVTIGSASGDDFNVDSGKLVVEGDTGRVGVGTSAPNKQLEISNDGTSGNIPTLRLNSTESNVGDGDVIGQIDWKSADGGRTGDPIASIKAVSSIADGSHTDLTFSTGEDSSSASEKMRITSAGDVGVGASPTSITNHKVLELKNTASNGRATLALTANNAEYSNLYMGDSDDIDVGGIQYYHGTNVMDFYTGGSSRLQITATGLVTLSATGKVIEAGGNKDFVIVKDIINTATASSSISYMTINLNADLTCGAHITQVYSGVFGGIGYRYGVIETYVTRAQGGSYTINVKDSDGSGVLGVSGTGNVITLYYDTSGKSGSENAVLLSSTTVKIATGNESLGTPTFTLT